MMARAVPPLWACLALASGAMAWTTPQTGGLRGRIMGGGGPAPLPRAPAGMRAAPPLRRCRLAAGAQHAADLGRPDLHLHLGGPAHTRTLAAPSLHRGGAQRRAASRLAFGLPSTGEQNSVAVRAGSAAGDDENRCEARMREGWCARGQRRWVGGGTG